MFRWPLFKSRKLCKSRPHRSEQNLLQHVTNVEQIPSILVDIVRRLFPNSYFIVAKRGGDCKPLLREKLIDMIQSAKKRHPSLAQNSNHIQSVQSSRLFEEIGNDVPKVETTNPSRRQQSGTLILRGGDVHDREMREMFLLNLTTSLRHVYIIFCFAMSAESELYFVSFQCNAALGEEDRISLKKLENNLRTALVRTHMQRLPPDLQLDAHPIDCKKQGDKEDFNLAELLHHICMRLSRVCNGNLVFVLMNSVSMKHLLCLATSETYYPLKQAVDIEAALFKTTKKHGAVYELSNQAELWKIEDTLIGSAKHNSWKSLVCLVVHLPLDSNISPRIEINDLNPLSKHVGLDDAVQFLFCVVNLQDEKINSPGNRTAELDDVQRQVINQVRAHTNPIRSAYSHMCSEQNKSINQRLMNTVPNQMQSFNTSETWLKTMANHLQELLHFEECSVHTLDETENVWRTRLKSYPKEKHALANAQQPIPNIPSDMFNKGPRYIQTCSEKLNSADANVLWIPFKLESQEFNALVQMNSTYPLSSDQRRNITEQITGYCQLGLLQFQLLYKRELLAKREKVIENILSYHSMPTNADVQELCARYNKNTFWLTPDFFEFGFISRKVKADESVEAVLHMFARLQFTDVWRIPLNTLATFVLTVCKNYRTPQYHSWTHGFCVGHFVFLCLYNAAQRLRDFLDPLDHLALFVGALCHDIDHPGFNNAYQKSSNSALAALYGENGSILENHHLHHTLRILRNDECNIFAHFSLADQQYVLDRIRTVILATDLETHIRLFPSIKQMISQGYDRSNQEHRAMLLSLLATASDLSDQCKPWINTRIAAGQIYGEFFNQGDLERREGTTLDVSFDRERAHVPELQIKFLNGIVLPCFKSLSVLIPECSATHETALRNKEIWEHLTDLFEAKRYETYSTEELFAGKYDHLAMQYSGPLKRNI